MKEVKLSEFAPGVIAGGGDFKLPKITEFEGQNISITAVRFGIGNPEYGEYAVITLGDGSQCRSSNGVVLKQLHAMEESLDGKIAVTLKVMRPPGKRYYVLADPDPEPKK